MKAQESEVKRIPTRKNRERRARRQGGDSGSQVSQTGNGTLDFSKAANSGLIAIFDDF